MGLVGVGFALPSGAAEAPYTDSGTATAPAPTLGVTDFTFFQSCPESPAQGVDGWVFTLPAGYAGGRAVVTADGAEVSAYTYTDDCETSDLIEGIEDGIDLAADTRYLSVFSPTTANVTFWPLHGNRTYQLLSRSELGLPIWESVSGTPTPTPQAQGVFVLNTTNAPQSFYRLRVLMDPNSGGAALLSAPARAVRPPQFIEEFCGPFRVYVR